MLPPFFAQTTGRNREVSHTLGCWCTFRALERSGVISGAMAGYLALCRALWPRGVIRAQL
jgi:hypothetical protein